MIGVYGGTFNPVHFGHLRSALEVKEIFKLNEIRLIPCRFPPHRDLPEVSAETRFQLLKRAVDQIPGMVVDRRELDRDGPSYMVDTLKSLRDEPFNGPILLFIGSDAFADLNTWYRWQQLFDFAHVVVMTRPGYQLPDLDRFLMKRRVFSQHHLEALDAGCLFFQKVTRLEISSTAIRALLGAGRDPRFLLPDTAISYIKQHKLYQS